MFESSHPPLDYLLSTIQDLANVETLYHKMFLCNLNHTDQV